ncbi:VOC family protein [Aliiroseovarius subalbicans]|uniref:VOC family protein n=1 Tax=Aliiroseovarius subalbicans TaxID=2925840 RepID=UPI001F59D089|nr:VOC family protein [Aliiroseovarius subalbicans]MCI2400236.1 VOC family protein [Aliiroseovarius subalbicans]
MTMNRVTLITLGVKDIARSCAYYDAIGWVPENVLDDVAFYDMGGSKFGFFRLDMLAAEQGRPVEELSNGAMTLAQNFGSEADVDAQFAKALAAGARKVAAPVKTDWGGYSGYVADPDGHIWEFAFNPFWELDDEGHIG